MSTATIHPIKPNNKIAIIGSGISGLSCAWLLNQSQDITLYEKDDRLGGHANTVSFDLHQQNIDVDTGFIVFNPLNYPNLVRFLEKLNVESCDTEMSFGMSINNGELEYSGTGLNGLFAQKQNLMRPRFWSMRYDLMKFYKEAPNFKHAPSIDEMSLGELLEKYHCGNPFIYNHLLPMAAAIWSTPVNKMLDYPANCFIRFCMNHGLLQLNDRPQWKTIIGGSKTYVEKIRIELKDKIRLNTHIKSISRHNGKVMVSNIHGQIEEYDHVVFACHSDQALKLLSDATQQENDLLSCFPYKKNQAILHLDTELMPKRRKVWSSWNYLSSDNKNTEQQVSVSYWMNKLQPLKTETPIIVSLNPIKAPNPDSIIRSFFYEHPTFNQSSFSAQKQLWQLQGKQNTWFCGAYFGYGFHEDGLQSGLAVAEALGGIARPWSLENPNNRIYVTPISHAAINHNTAIKQNLPIPTATDGDASIV